MTQDPQPGEPRNELPEETNAGRSFPMLAPTLVVVVALVVLLVLWLVM